MEAYKTREDALEAYVGPLQSFAMNDVGRVGGKNASLGEMISNLTDLGIRVPGGFATTAQAYRDFLQYGDEGEPSLAERIDEQLAGLDVDDVTALAAAGKSIREMILAAPLPARLRDEIEAAWNDMVAEHGAELAVAVRSSATAEDLPEASFAGQQESFLNVRGVDELHEKLHEVFASLYNDRAIAYRVHQGFDHGQVALSAGVQKMVRSDIGASGVMFTLDTESGFREMVFITSAYGLGETVVQGAVNPDEFYVYKPALRADNRRCILRKNLGEKAIKMIYADGGDGDRVQTVDVDPADSDRFSLTDEEIETLARFAIVIEGHYGRPMDIEWGKDGEDGELYLLQARPETVQSHGSRVVQRFTLKNRSRVLVTGRSIGHLIGAGPDAGHFQRGRDASNSARRRAGRRHDGSGLGTGHEACIRDRDEPRRTNLPRRNHRPRTRRSCRRRFRQRDGAARGRSARHRVMRRG